MYNDKSDNKSFLNKTDFLKSHKNFDLASNLNVSVDQDFIDKKRIKSLKLFNICEFFRFLNKNFPEITNEDNLEISISLSKNLVKENKTLFTNSTKTKSFLKNLKNNIISTNELLLTEENLINICIILTRAFNYSKEMKVASLKHFFYLFDLDMEIFECIQETEKIRLENINVYNINKSKKQEINERKKITILKSLSSIFSFGMANNNTNANSSGNTNSHKNLYNKNEEIYLNKNLLKKQKGYNKEIHEEFNSLLELLLFVKSINFYLPEIDNNNKIKFLLLFFINFELLFPSIYQINIDFESRISFINLIEGDEIIEYISTNKNRFISMLFSFYFIGNKTRIKSLKIILPDSFLSEVDFILKDEKILLSDFHYLDLLSEKFIELNKLHLEFDSLDSLTFDRMIQIISNNKKIASLNINLFKINNEGLNLNKLRCYSNMINPDVLELHKNLIPGKNKKGKKDVILDEGEYLLSLILRPFANNLEKMFWNLIERKIHLKFVSINFEMPSYISNDDKYISLFQTNLFLFLEKISAVHPKHLNFNKVKQNKAFQNLESGWNVDDSDKHSFFSDFIKRKSLENTKKKLSFFGLNNINSSKNLNQNDLNTSQNEGKDFNKFINNKINKNNDDKNNNNMIVSNNQSQDSRSKEFLKMTFGPTTENQNHPNSEIIELSVNNMNSDSPYRNHSNDKVDNNIINNKTRYDNTPPKNYFSNQNLNLENSINKSTKNFQEFLSHSANSNQNPLYKNLSNNCIIPSFNLNKDKIFFEDNTSSNNKNYEESVISFDDNILENKINNDIALQSLEITAKNFLMDTRKNQIIERKFHYINLRENNLINLCLDFKIFKFSEKLFFKLIPKKLEDLKLSDLDFDSLKGLYNYFSNRRLNKLISLEVKVTNFFYENPEDLDLLTDFINLFKGDKLEEFTLKTKANFSEEKITEITNKVNGDYVKKFSLIFVGLKNLNKEEEAKCKNNYNNNDKFKNLNVLNFDINRVNLLTNSIQLKSYCLPNNFREIKAFVIRKLMDANLNILMNEIYSSSQCVKNTSNTSKSNSNNNFNDELFNYGKDQQIKLFKNIRKVVDNIRSFVKIKQEKIFKIEIN